MKLTFTIGTAMALAGILVASPTLVHLLRGTPPAALLQQLLLGATFFKIGLFILGVVVVGLGRLPFWRAAPPAHKAASHPAGKSSPFVLALILAAALALRLYRLDAGLWLDEILAHVLYVRLPFGAIITSYGSENQHFLYSLLAHASYLLFGESAWSLRLPAVVFGVASIWALYLFARQVGGDREALLAAALLTVSYHHIWFSQNARGYTGLLFWTLLSSWLFLRGLRRARAQVWLLYAAAASLGVYTHITMLFVIGGQFVIYLAAHWVRRRLDWPNRWSGLVAGFGLAGLLTLQLHTLVLPQMLGGISETVSVVEAWKRPLWTLLELIRGAEIGFAGGVVALAALVLFGAGLWSFARTEPAVIALLVIPAAGLLAVVVARGHHLWPRLFFYAIGFGVLVMVRGATQVGRAAAQFVRLPSARSALIGTALCSGLILVSALSIPPVYGPKQDYQGALDYVQASQEPGDAVVTVGLAAWPYQKYYGLGWEKVETLKALDAVRARAARTWVIYTFPPVEQSVYPEIMASVQRDFKIVREFDGTVANGTIYVYRAG